MALLTGVYLRFIDALASLRSALFLLLGGQIKASWRSVDWLFLTALAVGAGASILSFARVVEWLMEHYRVQLLCLFAGLVCYTAYRLARQVNHGINTIGLGLLGFVSAFFLRELALLTGIQDGAAPLSLFALGGALAMAAMMLPGISGSLLLLLLGMYQPVILALANLELLTLGVFTLGAFLGLLLFAPLLRYSYRNFTQLTLAFLAGLTFGAVRETLPLDHITSLASIASGVFFALIGTGLGKIIDHVAKFKSVED